MHIQLGEKFRKSCRKIPFLREGFQTAARGSSTGLGYMTGVVCVEPPLGILNGFGVTIAPPPRNGVSMTSDKATTNHRQGSHNINMRLIVSVAKVTFFGYLFFFFKYEDIFQNKFYENKKK